jgi:hypothetical protein
MIMKKLICVRCGNEIKGKDLYIQYDLDSDETNSICVECLEKIVREARLYRGEQDD